MPIFRRLKKKRIGVGPSDKAVALIIQRRAKRAGRDGDFGGHSPRSGFITEGGRQGIVLAALTALTGHQSVAAAIGCFQSGTATTNLAARMLDAAT